MPVMKYYGLDTLFPTSWGEDMVQTLADPTEKRDSTVKKEEVIQDQDVSDPLKIKSKVIK